MTKVESEASLHAPPPKKETYLQIKNLYKLYRGKLQLAALQGLNLDVQEGEVVAIEGPSGSGKTTLIQCIGGLQRATIGEIIINDGIKIDVTNLSDKELITYRKQRVGFVFQDNNLFARMTVLDNIIFPQIIAGKTLNAAKEIAIQLLKDVNMDHRLSHKPSQLSGGEKQRAAIAAALANDPAIILADEPTGELDAGNSASVLQLMYKLAKSYNKTILIVTHDPEISMRCDRIIRLQDGQVIGQASRDEFYLEVDQKTHRIVLPSSLCDVAGIDRFVRVELNDKGNIEIIPAEFQKALKN